VRAEPGDPVTLWLKNLCVSVSGCLCGEFVDTIAA
jgi:hypothetical protein